MRQRTRRRLRRLLALFLVLLLCAGCGFFALRRLFVLPYRAAVERELYGAKAPWQHDEEHYAFCGGGFPLYVNSEFRGAAIISGLPHLKDHALLCETVKAYWESKKK